MTQEEKARAYDKAFERAECIYNKIAIPSATTKGICTYIFPELRESEDEKIKNVLVDYFNRYKEQEECGIKTFFGIPTDKILAWLEKQGMSYTKRDVDDAYLKGISDTKNELEKQYEANYQIRKDIATFIFNYKGDIKDRAKWMNYLGIKVSFAEKQGEQKSDSFCREHCKGFQDTGKCFADGDCKAKREAESKEAMYNKPAWSEEDEHRVKDAIYFLDTTKKHYASTVELEACIDWLKSLKDRFTWKPSDEQLEALRIAAEVGTANNSWAMDILKCIYQYLKKLREE